MAVEAKVTTAESHRAARHRPALLLAALIVVAFSLRPALGSVGPLLPDIRAGLGMSGAVAGALTALPSAAFAVLGLLAPRAARRFGAGSVTAMAMAVLTVGLLLRSQAGSSLVLCLVSLLALGGIALGNVLLPVLVKQHFPDRVGRVTGAYSMSLTLGAALAAALSVPIADGLGGWRPALAVWAVPAAVAAVACAPLISRRRRSDPAPTASSRIVASPTAWALAVFFGLQAAGAYVVLGWLPGILQDAGVPAGAAGLYLGLVFVVGIPFALLLPTLAVRLGRQSELAVGLGILGLLGYGGLCLAPAAAPWLWAVLLGAAQSAFPLALTMISLRSRRPDGVARLSTFTQGLGYLISVPCPLIVGVLDQHTGGFTAALVFTAALLVPQTAAGWLAGRRRYVDEIRRSHPVPDGGSTTGGLC